MSRLFWKFFVVFLIAQLATVVGVGCTFWLRDLANGSGPEAGPFRWQSPSVSAAAATLRYSGPEALRSLLTDLEQRPGPVVYAIDSDGIDLLQRSIPAEMLSRVRHSFTHEGEALPNAVEVPSPDGAVYQVFIDPDDRPPWAGGKPGFGAPPGPPGLSMTPIIIGFIASLTFASLLAWYFYKPIRNLRNAFEAGARGDLGMRPGSLMGSRHDELADLARDFDRMAGQLRTLMDSQRRLLHDVSHEMRSPLARQQAALDLARQQPDKLADCMQRLERELNRMDMLVGELLALSRLEAGVNPDLDDEILLPELFEEIIGDARFEAAAQNKSIVIGDLPAASLRGNFELLRRAIENVVRNAVKHTPESTQVNITARVDIQSGQLDIEICDQGPGVRDAELDLIFEPFYRGADVAGTQGYGLGLAIARRVVVGHGGDVHARNLATGGLCVGIRLPLAQAGEPAAH